MFTSFTLYIWSDIKVAFGFSLDHFEFYVFIRYIKFHAYKKIFVIFATKIEFKTNLKLSKNVLFDEAGVKQYRISQKIFFNFDFYYQFQLL